jgi:hypothetical protein
MRRSDSQEGDAILKLVADLNNLMLVHVKLVSGIIVTRQQLHEGDEIGESVHSAFGVIKVDAGNPLRYYLLPLAPYKARNSFLASTVKRNALTGAKLFEPCMNLATNQLRRGSHRPLDSTSLLHGQNTAAAGMAGCCMLPSQRDFDLIGKRLHR